MVAVVNGVVARPTRLLPVSVHELLTVSITTKLEELTEDTVEPLQESHAVDEIKTFAGRCTNVVDNQIHTVGIAADRCVKVTL